MKNRSYLCAGLILCAIFFVLSGCFFSKQPQTEPTRPEELYSNAVSQLNAAADLSFQVTNTKSIQYQGQTFCGTSVQQREYRNIGTDALCATVGEVITIGQHEVETETTLVDGIVYLRVNDGYFSHQPAEPMAYTPLPGCLSPALYSSITSAELYGRTVLGFSQPSGPETWSISEGAEFLSAAGIAVLDESGKLQRIQYTLQYALSDAVVCERILIEIHSPSMSSISQPSDSAAYIPVTSPEAPVLLEKACGYLLQAQCIATDATETLESQIGGILRTQTTQLRLSGDQDNLNAWIDTGITLTNSSRGGETTTLQQTERFQDGSYSLLINGTSAAPEEEVTAESLQRYCNDILVGTIPLPGYITSAALVENDGILELTFQASEELASIISANACQVLYQDASLLDSLSAEYTIQEMSCYLHIHRTLGIPVACGLRYSASHTIEGSVYNITSQTDRTFSLIDNVFE